MYQQPTAHPDYESLKSVWNSIAQWVMNYATHAAYIMTWRNAIPTKWKELRVI
jgi:hypothetical protein